MIESTVLACCFVLSASSMPAEPPNVVMIVSDDQAYGDFGFMGHPTVRTPRLDRLASRSARYPNAYVPSSVCRPSLATLLTGLYPHRHGVYFNHPPPGGAALNRMSAADYYASRARADVRIRSMPSLPRLLAARGYDSLQTGKFWEGHHENAGFTHGMTTGRAAGTTGCWDKQLPDGTTVAHGNGDIGLTIGRSTMQPLWTFLDAHDAPDDPPFFIWYAPVLPHEPHNPPRRYLDMYRDDPRVPRHCVEYYATCTWFDDTVGQLIDGLEARDLARDTLFVFVVDNGWTPSTTRHAKHPGYHVDRRSKRSPFEPGLRTPILIHWDGRVKPATHEALCSSIDLVPSILHAIGLGDQAKDMPGVNMMPSAFGDRPLTSRPVFGEIYPGDATSLDNPATDVAYRWVRDGPWKLIVPHHHGSKTPWGNYLTQPALYHVVNDPGERTNLIADPQHADQVARLRALLDAWWLPD